MNVGSLETIQKQQNQGIKIEVNCQNDQLVNCEGTNQPTIGHNVADTWPTLANLDQHALKFWRNDGQFVRKLCLERCRNAQILEISTHAEN